MSSNKTKKEIIFGIFMKRIIIFLILIFGCIFGINFVLKSLTGEEFMMGFFGLNSNSYIIRKDLKSSDNLDQAKKSIFYGILDTILYEQQKEKEDKTITEFLFTVSDIKNAYLKKQEYYLNESSYVGSNLGEFENILSKIGLFQRYNLIQKDRQLKAKKVFFIQEGKYSYLLDISNQKNKSFGIKIYRAINDGEDETNSKVFRDFSMRVQFLKGGKKVFYLITKKGVEKEFFSYKNGKYYYSGLGNLKQEKEKQMYQNLLMFFVNVKQYLLDEKRNAFLVKINDKNEKDSILN